MKLSELNTDDALNVICEITPYIENIASDENIMNVFQNHAEKHKGETVGQQYLLTIRIISSMMPIILKTHRDDVYEILASLNNTDAATISKMNIISTGALIRDAIKDKDLSDFFKSCVEQEQRGA